MNLEQSLRHILLVDDNPNDRLLAIRELNRQFPDVQIVEVLDWAGLEQALESQRFDVAIIDYELHWATGLDILRTIKSRASHCPVILFTNSVTQDVMVDAMKAGLDDYVTKSSRHFVRLTQAVQTVWQNAQTRRKVTHLELQLRFLLNKLNVGVFRASLDGQLLDVSDGFLTLLDLTSREDAQAFFERHLRFETVDRTQNDQWEREVEVTCPTGKVIWVQINETRVDLDQGSVVDGLIRDITEQKRTTAAIQELNQTLEQRVVERTARLEVLNRELEAFTFSVSHNLRSPIRQIDGFVNLLSQHLQPFTSDETVFHYLHTIANLTERSGRMVEDLLQFSRSGRAEMQYTLVNMERLVQEVQRQLEPQLEGRTVIWHIEPLPPTWGDRNLLRQVWQNLIENAVKYTRHRERAEIVIGSISHEAGDEQSPIFFVRDNGIGFDTREVNHLFGIFQRLHNALDFDGTGIGLASVQQIVHRHQGQVWAEGTLDQGAVFYFSLPNRQPRSRGNGGRG